MTLGEQLGVAGLIVGIIGVAVTAAGFVIAIVQLRRTATAAEATQAAVERTEERTTLNYLLVLLPQFRLIESDLDYAAESDDRKLTLRALVAYSHVAHEVAVLIRGQSGVDNAVVDELEGTARAAARVKSEVVTSTRKPKVLTAQIRIDIGQMAGRLTGVMSQFRLEANRS